MKLGLILILGLLGLCPLGRPVWASIGTTSNAPPTAHAPTSAPTCAFGQAPEGGEWPRSGRAQDRQIVSEANSQFLSSDRQRAHAGPQDAPGRPPLERRAANLKRASQDDASGGQRGALDRSLESKAAPSKSSSSEGEVTTLGTFDLQAEGRTIEDRRWPSGWVTEVPLDQTWQSGQDVTEAIGDVAGLYVRRYSSLGQPAFVQVRGGNARQVVVLFNGVRISMPTGLGFDLGSLSAAGLDRVVIHRGSAGTVQGAGALSGAVELQSSAKLPSKTGSTDQPSGWSASASSFTGSFGTWGSTGALGLVGDFGRWEATASWRQSEGDFAFIDAQGQQHLRINNTHQRLSLSTTAALRSAASQWDLALWFESGEQGSPGPSEFQRSFGNAENDDQRLVATLGWTQRRIATADWGELDLRLQAGLQQRDALYENENSFLGNSQIRNQTEFWGGSARTEIEAYQRWNNRTMFGLEGRLDTFNARYRSLDTTLIDAQRTTLAAWLGDEWVLAEGALSLLGQLRTEYIDDSRRSDTPLMPSAGAIWRIVPGLKARGNIARSFRPPDFDELYLDTEWVRGNPDLAPERAWSWDVGLEFHTDPIESHNDASQGEASRLTAELVYFWRDSDALILFLPQTAYQFRALNLDEVHARGIESRIALQPFRRLRIRGGYVWTDAYLTEEDPLPLPNQPEHQAFARAELRLNRLDSLGHFAVWDIWSEVNWRSRIFLDHFASLSNSSFTSVNIGSTLRPWDQLEIGLQVQNLFDQKTAVDTLQRPLPGRAFFASLRLWTNPLEIKSP